MKNDILSKEELMAERWYVLSVPKVIPGLSKNLWRLMYIRQNNKDEEKPAMEYFVPMLVRQKVVNGKLVDIERPFCSYVFIKGKCDHLRDFHTDNPTFNLIPDTGRGKGYLYVGDREMEVFRYAVSAYGGCVPFVEDCPKLLEKGDRVRIIKDGHFYGMEGTLVNRQGKAGGRVLISICQNKIVIPTLEIEAKYLQPLAYSDSNKHLYRRLDIYHPQLVAAMKSYIKDKQLHNEAERSHINDFVARYSRLSLDSGKMRGRFFAYMLMSVTALDIDETDTHRDAISYYTKELLDNLHYVTNPATLAFAYCALYTATKESVHIEKAKELRREWGDENLNDKQSDVANYIKWCNGDFSESNKQ